MSTSLFRISKYIICHQSWTNIFISLSGMIKEHSIRSEFYVCYLFRLQMQNQRAVERGLCSLKSHTQLSSDLFPLCKRHIIPLPRVFHMLIIVIPHRPRYNYLNTHRPKCLHTHNLKPTCRCKHVVAHAHVLAYCLCIHSFNWANIYDVT